MRLSLKLNKSFNFSIIKKLVLKEKCPNVTFSILERQIDKNQFLYQNLSDKPKEIQMKGNLRSILFDKDYSGNFTISQYDPEFIEIK